MNQNISIRLRFDERHESLWVMPALSGYTTESVAAEDPEELGSSTVVAQGTQDKKSDFEETMFLTCRIPGLLPVRKGEWNGSPVYVYDIRGCRPFLENDVAGLPMTHFLKHLSAAEMALRDYLLSENHLYLTEETVFITDKGAVLFVYVPFFEASLQASVQSFVQQVAKRSGPEAAGYRFAEEQLRNGADWKRVMAQDQSAPVNVCQREPVNGLQSTSANGCQSESVNGPQSTFANGYQSESINGPQSIFANGYQGGPLDRQPCASSEYLSGQQNRDMGDVTCRCDNNYAHAVGGKGAHSYAGFASDEDDGLDAHRYDESDAVARGKTVKRKNGRSENAGGPGKRKGGLSIVKVIGLALFFLGLIFAVFMALQSGVLNDLTPESLLEMALSVPALISLNPLPFVAGAVVVLAVILLVFRMMRRRKKQQTAYESKSGRENYRHEGTENSRKNFRSDERKSGRENLWDNRRDPASEGAWQETNEKRMDIGGAGVPGSPYMAGNNDDTLSEDFSWVLGDMTAYFDTPESAPPQVSDDGPLSMMASGRAMHDTRGEQLKLVMEDAAGAPGVVYDILPYRTIIGRSPEAADIRLDSKTVNPVHAVLERQGDELVIFDLNSRNGTRVNGQQLIPEMVCPLRPGDVIETGAFSFRLNQTS
ncbi:MAG: DUF6382 domain-containing protein [Lachnospiraceae bacterium]|nr:DUF6382 domain-containing protein [Lachnospiraceae bacterium]